MFTSETGSIGFAIQDVQGTKKAPTDYMRVTEVSLNPEGDKLIPDPEIGAISDINEVHQGTYKIGGSLSSLVRPEAIGVLFYAAIGKYVTSGSLGSGAYLHNFQPIQSGSLPWLTIKHSISDNVEVKDYVDCKVDGFSIEINASEFASAKFDIVGISDEDGDAVVPSFETAPLLVATKATVNLGGVPVSVKSASVEFKNNLESGDFRVGSRFLGDISEKRREINVKLDVVLDTTSKLYKKAFYGASNLTEAGFNVHAESVDIILDSPQVISSSVLTYKILIQIKNAVFMVAPVTPAGDDLVVVPLELMATKLTDQNIIEVHIWNSKASY